MNDLNIIVGDCREEMAKLSEQSVQCVVTSPPYWGQRDYGVNGMIGLEPDVHEWIDSMVEVFRGVWRVLRDDGTVWLNLGDKYAAEKNLLGLPWRMAFALQADGWYLRRDIIWHKPNPMPESATDRPSTAHEYVFLLTKQPHYFYDSDAVKTPLSEVSFNRLTQSNFENQKGGAKDYSETGQKGSSARKTVNNLREKLIASEKWKTRYEGWAARDKSIGANLRSVWKIATQPFGGAHYATYPEKLVEPCIKAGTSERGECPACGAPWERVVDKQRLTRPELPKNDPRYRPSTYQGAYGEINGKNDAGYTKRTSLGWQPTCEHKREPIPQTVLDPFSGAGTTGLVALRLGRSYTGIELNPEYAAMSRKRIVERVGATSPDALKPDEQAQGRLI